MSSRFRRELDRVSRGSQAVAAAERHWIFVPYDQLTDAVGPLAAHEPSAVGIVLIESRWKPRQRPYHKQKLALLLANLRHFALEQAARGVAVRHLAVDGPYSEALREVAAELGTLGVMRPAERELREDLADLFAEGLLEELPHAGWLTDRRQFDEAVGRPPWRMDAFYRRVRRDTGLLMDENGKPVGGKFSFDADNRRSWSGDPPAPEAPRFEPTAVTREVCELVEREFPQHPGSVDPEAIAASEEQVEALWEWALEECLKSFGPYEDAMSRRSTGLFHTRISPLLNLLRLLPSRVVADVAKLDDVALSSREGFIRQVIGWREFVRHVHEATDGFREPPGEDAVACLDRPGDGGYEAWSGEVWPAGETPAAGGARPTALTRQLDLPPAFWGEASGFACLDRVVDDVWREAWSHHIPRLMVLANIATLLGVDPRQLTDWFWVAYVDAYDWVVEPNVLGMGTYAAGDLMTTKPYVSGAAYIHRMSDYCGECAFDPKTNCPLTRMYWRFLAENRERLEGNHRMRLPLSSLRRRDAEKRDRDREITDRVRERLAAGARVTPDDLSG